MTNMITHPASRLLLLLGAFLACVPAASALSISNVTVVNVTPGSFSVIWRTSSGTEPGIAVFADAAGTVSLAGELGIEAFPVHTGSPEAANNYLRRQSKGGLRAKTRSYGLTQVRVTRCRPDTTYYFRLTSSAPGETAVFPASGALPAVTTPAENSFVAESQQLLLEVPGLDNAGRLVTLTHSNAAHALCAVVGDGSGTNQVVFNLSDLFALAGQGNYMPLGEQEFAVDLLGGQGSQELSERFRVTFSGAFAVGRGVSNSFSIEFLALTVGSTIVRVGQTGSVPLLLDGNVRAADIIANFQVPTNRLGSLVVTNLHSSLASATVIPQSPSNATIQFTAKQNEVLSGGGFQLGQLQFLVLSNQSAFVPLTFTAPTATRSDGSSASNITLQAGRVVVIGREPLIETTSASEHKLMMYGNPWTGYALQYTTNLADPAGWTVLGRVPLTNLFASLNGLPRFGPNTFYRIAELADDPPSLEAHRTISGERSLILFGKPGSQYVLQSSANVGNPASWSTLAGTYNLTNSFRTIENLATNASLIFYRARKN